MKAVLVIDEMPNKCEECPLHYRKRQEIYRCEMTHKNIRLNSKPSWCPLKPMPKEEDIYEVGMDEEDTNEERDNKPDWWVSVEADATKRKTTRRRRL